MIEDVLNLGIQGQIDSLGGVVEIDQQARQQAQAWLKKQSITAGKRA